MAEFQQRLERCYRAKTIGELGELVRDLPRQEAQRERQSLEWLRAGRWALSPLALILVVLMVASAASGHHVLWLWIPLVFLFCRMSWWRRRRWLASARREPGEWV